MPAVAIFTVARAPDGAGIDQRSPRRADNGAYNGAYGKRMVVAMLTRFPSAVIMIAALAAAALADTHVVEVTDVQPGVFLTVDLGAQCSGITGVTIRAMGVGGRGFYECDPSTADGWYDLDCRVCAGVGCIEFQTSNQIAYDVTAAAVVDGGSWQAVEGLTSWPLIATIAPRGLPNSVDCQETVMEVQAVARLVITITADSVVAADHRSWGRMKATYRGGAGH